MRIGYGYDSHTFIEGSFLVLGGVKIPYDKAVKAHSDGDVLLHAVGDSLLGAAALGDLGQHFPDTDEKFRAISSTEILKKIVQLLWQHSLKVNNVDATVITEAPKLAVHINAMRKNIAEILQLDSARVSVKATTNEKMGWIGRGEGLAVHAVVTVIDI